MPRREDGEDVGLRGGMGGIRVEVGDEPFDVESVLGEKVLEFHGMIPAEMLGGFVGVFQGLIPVSNLVVVFADKEGGRGIDPVPGVDAGDAVSGQDGFVVEIPLSLGRVAGEFRLGDEDGQVEGPAGHKVLVNALQSEGGIRENLEGEGGNDDGLVGSGKLEGLDVLSVESGVDAICRGVFAAESEHVRRAVKAVDLESVLEEREQ